MSNELQSLLARVEKQMDDATARDLRRHIDALLSRRQFGLNFERHIPESVALIGRPISVGDTVRFIPPRGDVEVESDATWVVIEIKGPKKARVASLLDPRTKKEASRPLDDLVYVADFRDPIYPGLKRSGDPVLRGGDRPFHIVINAENYHALEALLFVYQGKVDCIYIDPPYNTRANDWKYNNDYVDPSDSYAHSKWLAFMERRLKLTRKLLNPANSVLIVTIDHHEVSRLGLLLEQTFPEARMQMVTSVINPRGKYRANDFARSEEYIFFLAFGDAAVQGDPDDDYGEGAAVAWRTFRRSDISSKRGTAKGGTAQFYPIYVDTAGKVAHIGEALPHDAPRSSAPKIKGAVAVFPIRTDGTEMNWGLTAPSAKALLKKGYLRVGRHTPDKPQTWEISYLTSGRIEDIETGRATVIGHNPDGSVIAKYLTHKVKMPTTTWNRPSHNAETNGTELLKALLGKKLFDFPKSLYAVEDALRLFVGNKRDALVLDFFAGSGTTSHAVMRLNRQDGGRRRSVSVTNNEVNDQESALLGKGWRPGDCEWESQGICERVTKPRIRAAVTGERPDGKPVEGDYGAPDEFPMSNGFDENVEFFTLTYENPALVELNLAFERIAPLLWMRAGSEGPRIEQRTDTFDMADTYGVLFNVDASKPFLEALDKAEDLRVAFIVTDDETQFQAVAGQLPDGVDAVRLYETYLRTFQINTGRH